MPASDVFDLQGIVFVKCVNNVLEDVERSLMEGVRV